MFGAAVSSMELDTLVNGPVLSHRLYTDQSIFSSEMERLFSVAWIYLGHECQLPTPGSYFLSHIGLASVIVTRDRQGEIHVLENRCAHRAAPVCSELNGSASALVCPYHGWTFGLDGSLKGMPLPSDYGKDFRNGRGLRRVARVSSYRGFIFASMAETGPSLETFLGVAKAALDDFMDRAPEGKLELCDEVPLRHRYRGNWKIQFENLNDFVHPGFAHASAMNATAAVASPASGGKGDGILDVIGNFQDFTKKLQGLESVTTEYGHSFIPGFAKMSGSFQQADGELHAVLAAKLGEEEATRIIDTDIWVALIYPSLIIKPGNQNLRIIRPLAADETEITMHSFRMPGAPPRVFDEAHDYYRLLGSPASPILADDLAIYEMVQSNYGREYFMSAERCHKEDASDTDFIPGTSEGYIRNQYNVWKTFMAGAAQ
jgi:phenylpropionate dioxygenase-like ring-hydroxylating dioxygenase large terminal subunit